MPRKFGLELEFLDSERSGISRKKLVDYCQKAIPLYDKKHRIRQNEERKTEWNIKYDGTCGHELTSPVLSLTQAEIKRIVGILNELNKSFDKKIPINSRCGFHIHFDISDLSLDKFKKVAWAFRNLENTLFNFYMSSRHGGNYSRKIKVGRWNPDQITRLGNNNEFISDHYTCLNTYRYNGSRKTCEIRHAEGTSDPDDVICWLLICALLIESAKNDIIPTNDTLDELKGFIIKNSKASIFRRNKEKMVKWVDYRTQKYAKPHVKV